jgi:hypothetical protein
MGGRGGEHVSYDCSIRKPCTHKASEGWIVARSATYDYGYFAWSGTLSPNYPALNQAHLVCVSINKPSQHVIHEFGWIIKKTGQVRTPRYFILFSNITHNKAQIPHFYVISNITIVKQFMVYGVFSTFHVLHSHQEQCGLIGC